LQRLTWTGKTPFEIKEMRARSDGFELVFTQPVDPKTARLPSSYDLSSYTYLYHSAYGSAEIQRRNLEIAGISISGDRHRVRLRVKGLRPFFVHELRADGVRNAAGTPLLHAQAYYTLNRIPRRK